MAIGGAGQHAFELLVGLRRHHGARRHRRQHETAHGERLLVEVGNLEVVDDRADAPPTVSCAATRS